MQYMFVHRSALTLSVLFACVYSFAHLFACIRHHSEFCKVFVSKAADTCKKGKLSDEHRELIKTLPCTQSNGLQSELSLYVGMAVFWTKNINQWDYLHYSADSTPIQ